MGLITAFLRFARPAAIHQQAVIAQWELPTEYCDLTDVRLLEDALRRVMPSASELDGHESGNHELILYMYGSSADEIWAATRSILATTSFGHGRATLRYGTAEDRTASQAVRKF